MPRITFDFDNVLSPDEVVWMRGRRSTRTYLSRSFPLNAPASQDHGQPARFIYKVFDTAQGSNPTTHAEEFLIMTTPGGRVQFKLLVAREAGKVKDLWIQKESARASGNKLEILLHLEREGASRLIGLLSSLDGLPIEGEQAVRFDDQLLHEILSDPDAVHAIYRNNSAQFRRLIQQDESAEDLIALAHRREQLSRFRELLTDDDAFEAEKEKAGGSEKVWQCFLEENPWILGVSLAGQLLTSWNDEKLEQTVSGFSIAGAGKRTDALMRTAGRIRSMVFAEIKHHKTDLLGKKEYRPGCWPPSSELSGGVVQIQQTVYRAVTDIGERLSDRGDDGAETGGFTYLQRPRSFLIVGDLDQLYGECGGIIPEKQRSFEMFRRNLHEPEVITFDELLARAEWHVTVAEQENP